MKKFIAAVSVLILCSFHLPNEKFVSKEAGFSLEVPAGYRAEKGTDEMIPVIIYSPKENDKDDFVENINVVTQTFEGTADDYYNANVQGMQNMMKDFKLLDNGTKTISGQSAHWFIYSFTYGTGTVKILAYCFAFNGKGLVVTCSSTPASFDRYKEVFEKACESLKKL